MSFTIFKNLEQIPSYLVLCNLAGQHQVRVTGNEQTGSFSCRGVEGDYAFRDDGIRGKFAGHGLTGEFSFEIGKATVTVMEKPFWLPTALLKQKIAAGLDTLCDELA